jgi:NAD(P)-dependent dehydrogenase (short-subunit alcohol dehydrogenase family)
MDARAQALFDLAGRVAIVTGGAKGIGRGIAENLALVGATVVIADVDAAENEGCAAAIRAAFGTCQALTCDMADESAIAALVAGTIAEYGRLDIVVNNAAIYPMSPIAEMSTALWDRVLGINLRGVFLLTRAALPHLVAAGGHGRLINVSSIDTAKSYVGMAHYDASKGGLEAFTRSCALELAPHGATANVIAPGAVKTPGSFAVRSNLARQRGEDSTAAVDAEFAARIPLGDWASPDQIGRAAVLLATPAAGYITGQTVYVDGGLMLTM